MTKELLFYGASDDYALFEGAVSTQVDANYGDIICKVTDANGEYILLYATFGVEGVDWKLRVQNPYNWDIEIGERPDYDLDPAFIIQTPTGDVGIEQLDEMWDDPKYDLIAV